MPVHDYICLECQQLFEQVLTLSEHGKSQAVCPKCGSKRVEQAAASCFAVTWRKS